MTDTHQDPGTNPQQSAERPNLWWRAVATIVFFILFAIAETVLFALTIIQFCWMLFSGGRRSEAIAEFGVGLGRWLQEVALFQTAQTDKRPFPWKETQS